MTMARVEIALWSAALLCGAVAAAGARTPQVRRLPAQQAAKTGAPPTASMMRDIDVASVSLVDADPFRAPRHPSPVEYRPELEGAPPPPPRQPKPGLSVTGIIGGPPWSVVVEGIPERPGSTVVQQGDTLGGLKVRSVKRDTVVITGMDTTWRLIVRRAW